MAVYIIIYHMNLHDEGRIVEDPFKGSVDKVNAFITLLYPYNGIKYNTIITRPETVVIS